VHKFKRITVWYQDDLGNSHSLINSIFAQRINSIFAQREDKSKPIHAFVIQQSFYATPVSSRIEYVKSQVELLLEKEDKVIVFTNDYDYIRLLEEFTPPDKFGIYQADSDLFVDKFVDLKPNPTLELGEFLYRCSVKRALKGS